MKTAGRKDYEKKRNVKNNNWRELDPKRPDRSRLLHPRLYAGDGILPKSRKWREAKAKV